MLPLKCPSHSSSSFPLETGVESSDKQLAVSEEGSSRPEFLIKIQSFSITANEILPSSFSHSSSTDEEDYCNLHLLSDVFD
ncbi:hypothetical protein CEXT_386541 [Caerostris extrusa]|uniref:Uncharacterized protein n=1 Tax=Caerostris extrusa TaxID=172846 RepID=A0AAV4Y7P1_CAEEX|nr:hypothetical protein CEXT_386541 [Caerostris extrusa]